MAGALDHDTTSSYSLAVKVSDPVDGEATATVPVSVTAVSGGGGGGGGGGCTLAPAGRFDPVLVLLALVPALALRRRWARRA